MYFTGYAYSQTCMFRSTVIKLCTLLTCFATKGKVKVSLCLTIPYHKVVLGVEV